MHCLSIAIGSTVWSLMFNTAEGAKAAYEKTQSGGNVHSFNPMGVEISDDYGQTVRVPTAAIQGVMLEDLDLSKLAHIERALHVQRTQLAAQKRWNADPELRAYQAGPAVLQPGLMNGGSFPRN